MNKTLDLITAYVSAFIGALAIALAIMIIMGKINPTRKMSFALAIVVGAGYLSTALRLHLKYYG